MKSFIFDKCPCGLSGFERSRAIARFIERVKFLGLALEKSVADGPRPEGFLVSWGDTIAVSFYDDVTLPPGIEAILRAEIRRMNDAS